MKKFLIVRTNGADDFRVTGEVTGLTEIDAYERARKAGMAPRHSSHLMLLDESSVPFERRTYKIDENGLIIWLVSKDFASGAERKRGSGSMSERRTAASPDLEVA